MLNSYMKPICDITFPEYKGRQKYMMSFQAENPIMAEGYEDYLDPVTKLLKVANVTGEVHMTVDEKIVQPGMSQRRPGAHVDGRFMKEQQIWGQEGPGRTNWAHYCNQLPIDRMSVIVAASYPGCIVYEGQFDGTPKNDGDLEHIRDQFGEGELLPANYGYLLSPDCVHESVIYKRPTQRQFLRIAFG